MQFRLRDRPCSWVFTWQEVFTSCHTCTIGTNGYIPWISGTTFSRPLHRHRHLPGSVWPNPRSNEPDHQLLGLSSCWHQCGRSVMRPESGSTCRPALSYDQLCGSYSALIKCSSARRHCSPRTQWPYASEPRTRRLLLCAGAAYPLSNVLQWGHPEDAVAVAFLLYACLAASDKRWAKSAWLFGAAVAFQPFVLLALAPLYFPAGLRRLPSLLAPARHQQLPSSSFHLH